MVIAPRSWRTAQIFGLDQAVESGFTGDFALTVPQPNIAFAGTVTNPPITGTFAITVPQPQIAFSGTVTAPNFTGTFAITVPQPLIAFTGTVPVEEAEGGGGRPRRRVREYPKRKAPRVPIEDLPMPVDQFIGAFGLVVPTPRIRFRGYMETPAMQIARAGDERYALAEVLDDPDLELALTLADTWLK